MKRALIVAAAVLATASAQAAELTVAINGIAHADGSIRVVLYGGPDGFRKEDKAQAIVAQPAAPGSRIASFPGLAPGRYAVVAYHDENDNGAMDRFLGMIPTEGYGLSNNPEVSGPPQFEECAFSVTNDPAEIVVELRY